ncbi:enoyl-CoA hydratase/isomerase family protein [Dehalococcoidia bacterium]|nr:enoyl-CoA hydratase/isomerase family protein [Dehalococcoidia bacterium]
MPDLLYETYPDQHYAVFTMNRPDQLNARNASLNKEFDDALYEFEMDPEMRCGIVTGSGRAFSAGADLKQMSQRFTIRTETEAKYDAGEITKEERTERLRAIEAQSPLRIYQHPKPVIAAINGLCIAAGMETAIDCDIRIASSEAYFGLFEVKRGIMAGYAIEHLARVMPYGEAMYVLLTGDRITVEDAHRVGFIHEILEPDRLMPRAIEIAEMIASNAPLSVQGTKAVTSFWRRAAMEESHKMAEWCRRVVWDSDDAKEGPKAFSEKRPAVWTGR